MQRALSLVLVSLLAPTSAFAAHGPASFSSGQSLVIATSSPGNAYAAGASVVLAEPVSGDFVACGGSIITTAPVAGDDLLLGGSIDSRANVAGDVRAVGGSITADESIGGDLFATGFSVNDAGHIGGSTLVVAMNTVLSGGASGPVTVYGNNVALGGNFSADVTVFAIGHLTLAPGTIIRGKLSYEAPEMVNIPASATIVGGATYTSISYLPDAGTSRVLALFSIGLFLIARIVGALILAGLLAGLFPAFAEALVRRTFASRSRSVLLSLLLGLAVCFATPIAIILLALTFVGIGLAFLITILYLLLSILALMYAGVLLGGMLARRLIKRETVVWHDGVLGMFILSVITLIPFVGFPVVCLFTLFVMGALLQIFFSFAFPHEEHHSGETS